MEDRDLPQDSKIWMQGRGFTAAYRRPTRQSGFRLLHHQLAYLLVDDAQSDMPKCRSRTGTTDTEIDFLNRLVKDRKRSREAHSLSRYLEIAQLGGYLARANAPSPGNTVMWRGMRQLTDMQLFIRKIWVIARLR
jgi:hypothetical protein